MSRRPTTRLAALWIALFLLLSQGSDALGLHTCPLHSSARHQHTSAPEHATHAGGQHGAPQEGDDAQGPCTCVSACCPTAGGASAPQPVVSWRPLSVVETDAPLDAARSITPLRSPYLLPYAQAPPPVG